MNICIFIRGFRVSIRVSGIRGFGFGDGFPPESVSGSGSGSGFDFGFRFWVHGDSTRSEPDPLPSLCGARFLTAACLHVFAWVDPTNGFFIFFYSLSLLVQAPRHVLMHSSSLSSFPFFFAISCIPRRAVIFFFYFFMYFPFSFLVLIEKVAVLKKL